MTRPSAALAGARILIVGLGGLGCPAARELARAGIGHLGLADADLVELSNLPRQILYRDADIGLAKTDAAAQRLRAEAPDLDIITHRLRLGRERSAESTSLFRSYDFVVDGTDSLASKSFLNDLAIATDRPLAHAGITAERGQLLTVLPRRSACLRCIFGPGLDGTEAANCSNSGVFGPLVGLFGSLQAGEAIKFLEGSGVAFADRLLVSDHGRWRALAVARDPQCSACGP